MEFFQPILKPLYSQWETMWENLIKSHFSIFFLKLTYIISHAANPRQDIKILCWKFKSSTKSFRFAAGYLNLRYQTGWSNQPRYSLLGKFMVLMTSEIFKWEIFLHLRTFINDFILGENIYFLSRWSANISVAVCFYVPQKSIISINSCESFTT